MRRDSQISTILADEKAVVDAGNPLDDIAEIRNATSLDVAVTMAARHAGDPEVDSKTSLKVRRKIDWYLLPLLGVIYTCTSAYLTHTCPDVIHIVQFADKFVPLSSLLSFC